VCVGGVAEAAGCTGERDEREGESEPRGWGQLSSQEKICVQDSCRVSTVQDSCRDSMVDACRAPEEAPKSK
jgi:hypothetical protein